MCNKETCFQIEEPLSDGLVQRDPHRKVESSRGESGWQLRITTTPRQYFKYQAVDFRQPGQRKTKSNQLKFMKGQKHFWKKN